MSRMIAIASGKGGVGKTWLAISLSHALAQAGQRVLLFDGDLGLANVDVQLGLEVERDLGNALTGICGLPAVVKRVTAGGFDLIPGRSGSGQLATLPGTRLAGLLAELRTLAAGYDLVLLDLPAGIDQGVRASLAAADEHLVVTTDEPTALTDAYALIKVGRGRGPVPRLVINQAATVAAGIQTHEGLERVCGRFLDLHPPLAGVIRRDPRVPDAIREQALFLTRSPNSLAARDLETLATRLVEHP